MSFFSELRRRNVFKVAAAYAIVGWLLVQIADVFFPALQLPDWTVTLVAALLILGFPIALLLSWAYELTPDGMKQTESIPVSESIAKMTGRKLDWVIIGLLLLAVVFMFVDNYLPESRPFAGADIAPASLEPALGEGTPSAVQETPAAQERREVLPNSVAVLPFVNLSDDPDDAFFAAGIHEEILNQLVKLSRLNVIARTTMMQYANREFSIPQVAEELNVKTVMEGSVRYAGGRVLVTAQLIDPETNTHLWSESYNRSFADIFAVQADVAMNIANALNAAFSAAEQENIESIPTVSPEAYSLYLRYLSPIGDISDLDAALELDPNFAAAYAAKAWWHASAVTYSADVETTEEERLALENANRALELDPSLGLAYLALATVHEVYWRWTEAIEAYEMAYRLSPNDITLLPVYGRFKRNTGDYDAAIRIGVRAVELDPLNNAANNQLGVTYRFARDHDAAAQIFRRRIALDATAANAYSSLGTVEAARGNDEEAVRDLRRAEELFGGDAVQVFRYAQLAMGYALANRSEDVDRMLRVLEDRSGQSPVGDAVWALAEIARKDYERALQYLEAAMASPSSANYVTLIEIKANPWGIPELDTPRFREVLDPLWAAN